MLAVSCPPKIGATVGADTRSAGEPMTKDWQAVATAISARLTEIDMTQSELAQRADVALETVRELHHNLRARRRSPRTLAALSQALGWPDDHLMTIADGTEPSGDPTGTHQVLAELADIREALSAISTRLDGIERRLPEDTRPG